MFCYDFFCVREGGLELVRNRVQWVEFNIRGVALNWLIPGSNDGLYDAVMTIAFHDDNEFLGQLKVHKH